MKIWNIPSEFFLLDPSPIIDANCFMMSQQLLEAVKKLS